MHQAFDLGLLLDQDGQNLGAHAGAGGVIFGDVDGIHSVPGQIPRPLDLPLGVGTLRRDNLHQGDELPFMNLGCQPRTGLERRRAQRLGRRERRRDAHPLRPRAERVNRILNLPDVLRGGAAAAAHQRRSGADEARGIVGHIFGRAKIDVAALDPPRQPRVRLDGELPAGHARQCLQRLQHRRRTYAAIQPNDVRPGLLQPPRELFGSGSGRRRPVFPDGHLNHDGQLGRRAAGGFKRLQRFVDFRHGLDHEQVHAAFRQNFHLFAKRLLRFGDPDRAHRLQQHAQRPDGSGHQQVTARHLARQPHTFPVDLVHLRFRPRIPQPKTIRPEGVRLQNIGPGLAVSEMNFLYQRGLRQVQFFETDMAGEVAFFIEQCSHGAVTHQRSLLQFFQERVSHSQKRVSY